MATMLVLVGLGGALLVAQYVPVVLYQHRHGSNLANVNRGLYSVEFYSLKLSDMLLPVHGHRIQSFAKLQRRRASSPAHRRAHRGARH